MSVPRPDKTLDIIHGLEQGLHAGESLSAALETSLATLLTCLPSASRARLYRFVNNTAALEAATDGAAPAVAAYSASVSPHYDTAHTGWVIPVQDSTQTIGVLEVQTDDANADTGEWLRLLAYYYARLIGTQRQGISDAQATVFSELNADQDPSQMIAVIARHLLPAARCYLSLTSLQRNEQGQVMGFTTLAAATRNNVRPVPDSFPVVWAEVSTELRAGLENGESLIFEDVSPLTEASVGPGLYRWLRDEQVASLLNIPLRVAGQTQAMLTLIALEKIALPRDLVNTFRGVGDLVGNLLHVRHLLDETRLVREVADDLVLSSRLITTAENYDDMAQAAMYTVAKHMNGIAITLFDQPLDALSTPTRRALVALGLVDGPVPLKNISYSGEMPPSQQLKDLWRGLPVIVEDVPNSAFTLAPQVYQQVNGQPVNWLSVFGLRAGDQVLGTLEVLQAVPYQLSTEEIDTYITLADQIGVSIRNRQLLQQTTSSLNEARILYEINRTMLAAQDMLDILRCLRDHLATDAVDISHAVVRYDASHQISDVIIAHQLQGGEEKLVQTPILRASDQNRWQRPLEPVTFIDDLQAADPAFPISIIRYAQSQGGGSLILLSITRGSYLHHLFMIVMKAPQHFDERTRQLYEALREQISIVLQSQELLQETQHHAARLSNQVQILGALNQLAISISSLRQEQALLDESCRAIVDALHVDHAGIVLLEAAGKTGVVVSEYPDHGMRGSRLEMSDNLLKTSSDLYAPLVMNNVADNPDIDPANREMLAARGVTSIMVIPMLDNEGKVLGSIGLDLHDSSQTFNPEITSIAQIIGAQVATGLQNIRLLADAQHRSEQLQRISQFGQAIQANLNIDRIIEIALVESSQVLRMDRMVFDLVNEQDNQLYTVARYANGQNFLMLSQPERAEQSLADHAWNTSDLLYIPDTTEAAQYHDMMGNMPGMQSILVMPVFSRGRRLGMISIGAERPYAFQEVDIFIFEQMARQLAITLENAMVYTQSQRQAQTEALVNNISAHLQRQIDIEGMLNVTVAEVGRALGARKARIRLGLAERRSDGE